MRLRTLALTPALAFAMLSISAGGASAVTLFTSAAHTVRVPVGATATLTAQNWQISSGAVPFATCTHAQVNVRISQNNDTLAIADTIGGSLTGCGSFTATPTFLTGSRITFGAHLSSPPLTAAVTRWDGYVVHTGIFGPTYTGDLTGGITTTRTPGSTPTCVTLAGARTLTTSSPATGFITANFCFAGTAASWSFT
jgi:hypothetical protein